MSDVHVLGISRERAKKAKFQQQCPRAGCTGDAVLDSPSLEVDKEGRQATGRVESGQHPIR